MEKYGVETEDPQEGSGKTASKRSSCPTCGSPLELDANVPKCRACGTKPFEKKPEEGTDG